MSRIVCQTRYTPCVALTKSFICRVRFMDTFNMAPANTTNQCMTQSTVFIMPAIILSRTPAAIFMKVDDVCACACCGSKKTTPAKTSAVLNSIARVNNVLFILYLLASRHLAVAYRLVRLAGCFQNGYTGHGRVQVRLGRRRISGRIVRYGREL